MRMCVLLVCIVVMVSCLRGRMFSSLVCIVVMVSCLRGRMFSSTFCFSTTCWFLITTSCSCFLIPCGGGLYLVYARWWFFPRVVFPQIFDSFPEPAEGAACISVLRPDVLEVSRVIACNAMRIWVILEHIHTHVCVFACTWRSTDPQQVNTSWFDTLRWRMLYCFRSLMIFSTFFNFAEGWILGSISCSSCLQQYSRVWRPWDLSDHIRTIACFWRLDVPHKAGILVTHADIFLHLLFFHSVLSLDNIQLQLLSFTLWLRMLSCFARADDFLHHFFHSSNSASVASCFNLAGFGEVCTGFDRAGLVLVLVPGLGLILMISWL